jgi:riboflavin kinase / FMN adenylyltransferase
MIKGIVQQGQRRAREFGYPTANIPLDNFERTPGTYAAHVTMNGSMYTAAVYISKRNGSWMCEVHLIDQDIELYGKEMSVELLSHISEIDPFESTEQMQQKIDNDMTNVRNYHKD